MREGYDSRCLSVTTLAATYLVCESNLRCCKVTCGVPNAWFVWISPKTLRLLFFASFADSKLLDFSICINRTLRFTRYIRYVHVRIICMCSRHGYNNRWCWSEVALCLPPLLASFRRMKSTIVSLGASPFVPKEAGSWLDVGTAMSVEFDTTHQGCFCCELT